MIEAEELSVIDRTIIESFAKDITEQNRLMDDIATQLITMELAIPALYATGLKLIYGKDAVMLEGGIVLLLGFGFWFLSLIFTFVAIFPKKYSIDKNSISEIEGFYSQSARYKATYLSWGAIFFFVGILFSLLSMMK